MKDKCFIYIQAGAGGDDTKRQASDIARNLWKYCEKKNYKYDLEDEFNGEIIGRGCL
jgi:protein subunit release factor B